MGRKKDTGRTHVGVSAGSAVQATWRRPHLRMLIYAVALTVLYTAAYSAVKDDRVFLGGDNADYHILAESIAGGQGYRYTAMPEAPLHNHFPPGYPTLLAACMELGVMDHASLGHLNGLFLWVALICLLVVFTRWCDSPELAALAIGLCALNAHLLGFATVVMSEIPYLMFLSVALLCYMRAWEGAANAKATRWWLLGLVTACIVMVFMRTAGLVTVFGFAVHMLWRRKRIWAAILLSSVIVSQIPWSIRNARLGPNPYVEQLMSVNPYHPEDGKMQGADWFRRIGRNAARYIMREVPTSVLPWTTRKLDTPLHPSEEWPWMVIVIPLLLLGLWRSPRDRDFLVVTLACSFGVLMLWPPVWAGTRFMMALVPLCVLLTMNGAWAALTFVRKRTGAPVWAGWAGMFLLIAPVAAHSYAHVLLSGAGYNGRDIHELASRRVVKVDRIAHICYAPCIAGLSADRHNPYAQGYDEYMKLAKWADTHLPDDSSVVVCCRKPGLFHLLSHRRVTSFLMTDDPGALIADPERKKVTHVVLDQIGFADVGRYLYPAVQHDRMKFPVLKEIQGLGKNSVTRLTGFLPALGYHGAWKGGLKNGRGTVHFSNGDVFDGIWINDTVDGEGVLRRANGHVTTGYWYDNTLRNDRRRTP